MDPKPMTRISLNSGFQRRELGMEGRLPVGKQCHCFTRPEKSMSAPGLTLLHDPGRVAYDGDAGRNILCHNRAHADHRALADS